MVGAGANAQRDGGAEETLTKIHVAHDAIRWFGSGQMMNKKRVPLLRGRGLREEIGKQGTQ